MSSSVAGVAGRPTRSERLQSLERGLSRPPGIRCGCPGPDDQRGGRTDRPDARHRAPRPAHPRGPRLRRVDEADLHADTGRPGPRQALRRSRRPVGVREALPRVADRADRRVGVDRRPRRHRDPVRRAGRDAPADDHRGHGRVPPAGPRHVQGPRPARRSARRRARGLLRPDGHRALHRAHRRRRDRAAGHPRRDPRDRAGRSSTSSWRRGSARWRPRSSTATAGSSAALSVCAHAGRVDPATLRSEFLPLVVETARRVSAVGTRH